jgi:hypothetical protein
VAARFTVRTGCIARDGYCLHATMRQARDTAAANADKKGAYSRLRPLVAAPGVGGSMPPERIQAELDRLARKRPGELTALLGGSPTATACDRAACHGQGRQCGNAEYWLAILVQRVL